MLKRNSRGQVVRVFSYTSQMRKHGGDRQFHTDGVVAALNAIPRRAAPCNAAGVIVRKARKAS